MKKHIILSIFVLLSLRSYSNEWIGVGEQPELINSAQLETQLWEYIQRNSNSEFEPKEKYRFQYSFIDESHIFINALCLQAPKNSGIGTYPSPTNEELKKEFYRVRDGGSCFFSIKYNKESSTFYSLLINGRA